ncbi:MAG: aspartate/glutamate racemase family protein [Clostridia bacterium]|nr:aspartate/glutamate racemase family protein [Clostridia bacterium]
MEAKRLGILGGLGPMSTFYFCELLTAHTRAEKDCDHIDMIISSCASTPDRTAFILGESDADPLPAMLREAHRLESAGADLIVIPCNTAHYFYDGLTRECRTPILNIIRETVDELYTAGVRRIGLLATAGTVRSGAYRRVCDEYGMDCLIPDEEQQAVITSLIYDRIKQNKSVDLQAFLRVAEALRDRGCEKLVLGCTELSLLKKQGLDERVFVDSLEILAKKTILSCGKEPIGFGSSSLFREGVQR